MSNFRLANPPFEIQYDDKAMFKPWDVVEVRIEGVGYKHYKVFASFVNNADALDCCNNLNKAHEPPIPERTYFSGFYR